MLNKKLMVLLNILPLGSEKIEKIMARKKKPYLGFQLQEKEA
jgi:hypothetical protein